MRELWTVMFGRALAVALVMRQVNLNTIGPRNDLGLAPFRDASIHDGRGNRHYYTFEMAIEH